MSGKTILESNLALKTMLSDSKTFAICTFFLIVKWYATLSIQGKKRFAAGSRPPEDNSLPVPDQSQKNNFVGSGNEEDIRWQRIVSNDLENIPLGLIVQLTNDM